MVAVCQTQTLPSFTQLALSISENQIPARGLKCGAHTAPLTVPLPNCFLTWKCNLGTEAITASGNMKLSFTWGKK